MNALSVRLRCCFAPAVVLVVAEDTLSKIGDHERETLAERNFGFPSKKILGLGDVWLPLVRVVLRVRPVFYLCIWVDRFLHDLLTQHTHDHFQPHRHRCRRFFNINTALLGPNDLCFSWFQSEKEKGTLASSSMVNSPGFPRLKGPMCSPSISLINPSTYQKRRLISIKSNDEPSKT